CLVEEDVLTAEGAAAHLVAASDLDVSTELREGVNVRVEPAASDHVASRGRDGDGSEPCEQRAREQERGTHPAAQLLVQVLLRDVGGMDVHLIRPAPVPAGA